MQKRARGIVFLSTLSSTVLHHSGANHACNKVYVRAKNKCKKTQTDIDVYVDCCSWDTLLAWLCLFVINKVRWVHYAGAYMSLVLIVLSV